MSEIRIAAISDIHGNRWALEAVLEDIGRRGIDRIVNLGDSLYGPLDPGGTARILLELDLPTVRGNEDRLIIDPADKAANSPTLRYVRDSLRPEHLRWLETLPRFRVAFEHFRLCHGTMDRDDEYLLQEVKEAGVSLRGTEGLAARLGAMDQPILLCGHDHVPRTVHLPKGRLIVNPGSVGLPAYRDDLPHPHAMQTGTPEARYSVICRRSDRWHVEDIALPYNWSAATTRAEKNGRPDWASWLRTGRAGGT